MTVRAYTIAIGLFGVLSAVALAILAVALIMAPSALVAVFGLGPFLFLAGMTALAWRCRSDLLAEQEARDLEAANEREDHISRQ
ncbi:hypothetical protein EV383_4373 [Pseudonocardia sediminis]|uniref:Uncharacterized protein n=1 Tax=Pseudonocardia sediminis TaxID=1397368 RepID=A0A4Q7V4C1_PSEST|nr:hypothetical protein [Pseudonocardia sediminis]RZT87449.1 hypothetical protein EV383_4373 [Pseudonocardia sediminis]